MRMWGVGCKYLCNQHLLGEHLEMHMFTGTIKKGIKINGYIRKGLVNPPEIKRRHDQLAEEMIKRGMNHKSPLQEFEQPFIESPINVEENLKTLSERCPNCRQRIKGGRND